MKKALALYLWLFSFPLMAVALHPEYNTWYYQNGVLYDVTQTPESQPVLISIAHAGYVTANMVVSLYAEEKCPAAGTVTRLKINGTDTPANFSCQNTGTGRIEHYVLNDAGQVNQLVNRLREQFTLVLQDDIKVWAANINQPRYGLAPGM